MGDKSLSIFGLYLVGVMVNFQIKGFVATMPVAIIIMSSILLAECLLIFHFFFFLVLGRVESRRSTISYGQWF